MLYAHYFYAPEANDILSDQQMLAQMLRFEGTLAQAQAHCGLITQAQATSIVECCKVELLDFEDIIIKIPLGGNAAIPLVKQLTALVSNQDPEAAKYVHWGATSQDVVDTARVLQVQTFTEWLKPRIEVLLAQLRALTLDHHQTLMIGRTLLQQARPITFGLKTAKWLQALRLHQSQIQEVQKMVSCLTLGGAVGSGNEQIDKDIRLKMAELLGLNANLRLDMSASFASFGSVLGLLSGSLGKIAKDISLLMQTEVGEVFEGAAEGKGGSSTMPHKRNPVACAAIIANQNRVPHLVATLLSAMPQEHERSAGLWHSDWEVLDELMLLTAGSVEQSIELLGGLEIDKNRMLANLELTQGLIYAEGVSLALAQAIGKAQAHEIVEKACKSALSQRKHLKEILEEMNLPLPNLNELFKPENAIGNTLAVIDEILT